MSLVLPPTYPNEEARLSALLSYGILNTPPEAAFDDITRLIAEICDVPIALVTLIEGDRQWFKSAVGAGDITETPRDIAFCAHALVQNDLFLVPDMCKDSRFVNNPLVTGPPHIRFYAGAVLRTPEGFALGTLCVLDTKPRTLTAKQENALRVLAREVVTQIELRQRVREQEILLGEREQARLELAQAVQKHQRVAETLQRSLLLAPPPDAFPGLRVAHFYEPAWDEALVGGDFYDVFALRDDKIALVVGDVVGKGLAAATYTAEVKFTLRSFLREGNAPADALARLNHVVIENSIHDRGSDASGVYVALVIAVLDTKTGQTVVASAGAEPPFILRGRENRMEEVDVAGTFVGADPDAAYEQVEQTLRHGDALLLFSDGITEARQKSRFFGPEGIAEAALRAHTSAPRVTPALIGRTVLDAAHECASGKLHDDACLIVACLHDENGTV